MSETTTAALPNGATNGVIHDIGYQRYEGPRLGRAYAVRSLYSHGLRTAFGLGRSAVAKVFPWSLLGLLTMIAAIMTAIRAQSGQVVTTYWEFPSNLTVVLVLFCATVAPELVSRDIRGSVLPLYFSRPLTRTDYALAKWAALVTSVFLLILAPLLLMFAGAAFSMDGMSAVWTEFVQFSKGVGAAALYGIVFGSLSILIASLAGRRAVAAALIVAVFLVTTPVWIVLNAIAYSSDSVSETGELTGSALELVQLSGLVSPGTLVSGVGTWFFASARLGDYGPLYGAVALALTAACLLLLLLRYRKVAR
jgi:ABC-2 type transport system permease protein